MDLVTQATDRKSGIILINNIPTKIINHSMKLMAVIQQFTATFTHG